MCSWELFVHSKHRADGEIGARDFSDWPMAIELKVSRSCLGAIQWVCLEKRRVCQGWLWGVLKILGTLPYMIWVSRSSQPWTFQLFEPTCSTLLKCVTSALVTERTLVCSSGFIYVWMLLVVVLTNGKFTVWPGYTIKFIISLTRSTRMQCLAVQDR